jgi:hypothetical protein
MPALGAAVAAVIENKAKASAEKAVFMGNPD